MRCSVSHALLSICSLLLILPTTTEAQPQFQARIVDRDLWVDQGILFGFSYGELNETVSTCLWADRVSGPDNNVGGFDFMVCYDNTALTYLGTTEGPELHPDWEYFSIQHGNYGDSCGVCPNGFVRVYGLTNTLGGIDPAEDAYDLDGCIAEIQFQIGTDPLLEGQFAPLGFCTIDCTDNVIASRDGDTLYVPASGITPGPNYDSALCRATDPTAVLPEIAFTAGGIWIVPPPVDRGDVNLNAIAYELADWSLFFNFLHLGDHVFAAGTFGDQLFGTEADCDGFPATAVDLVKFRNVVSGEQECTEEAGKFALSSAEGPAPSTQDTLALANASTIPGDSFAIDIHFTNVDTIGAVSIRLRYDPDFIRPMIYEGSTGPDGDSLWSTTVELLREAGSIALAAGTPEPGTLTLTGGIVPVIPGTLFLPGGGPTFRTWWQALSGFTVPAVTNVTFESNPQLPSVYNTLSDPHAAIWKSPVLLGGVVVIDSIPSQCVCPFQSDHDISGSVDATDLAIAIDITFFGAPDVTDPYCPRARADSNADGGADAVDLALLIDHVFFGGTGPTDPCGQ